MSDSFIFHVPPLPPLLRSPLSITTLLAATTTGDGSRGLTEIIDPAVQPPRGPTNLLLRVVGLRHRIRRRRPRVNGSRGRRRGGGEVPPEIRVTVALTEVDKQLRRRQLGGGEVILAGDEELEFREGTPPIFLLSLSLQLPAVLFFFFFGKLWR